MSQHHPLEKVIRQLDSGWSPTRLEGDERIVIIDARSGEALAKMPLLSLGRDIRRYLVNTRNQAEMCKGPRCKIKSSTTQRVLDFETTYEARCERGNETRLAAALAKGLDPATMVDRFITDRVQELVTQEVSSGRDVCLDFLQIRGFLQSFVADKARSEIGLTLELKIVPSLESQIKSIPVESEVFPIRVSDQDYPIDLKLSTELEIDPSNKMRALLFHDQMTDPVDLVRQVVRKTMAEEVNLHRFHYELTGWVRSRLIEALNSRLQAEGWKVSFLRLEVASTESSAPSHPHIEHTVKCRIIDCEEPIQVKHHLKLTLKDLGRFRASGVSNLTAWVTACLDEVTRDVLFERRYIDVLLDFPPDEAEIKSRMEHEACRIGYTVKQMIAAPALKPLEWQESGFFINDISDSFATRDSRIDVKLNIVVRGKIGDLRDSRLQKYLTPKSRLLDSIRKMAEREVRQLIHGVSPEHFYMRFAYSDDPAEPAVTDLITTRIRSMLSELYGIEDSTVIPKPLETELTKKLDSLRRGPHKLEVTCTPHNRGGEEVSYRIYFDILGVPPEGWYVFRSKNFPSAEAELDMIREVIAEVVKNRLQVAPEEILQFTELSRNRDLTQVIQHSVQKEGEDVFGLRIQLININRLDTYGEQKSKDVVRHAIDTSMETGKEILLHKRASLSLLYQKKLKMIEADIESDDPILMDLEQRIKKLEEEISPDQLSRSQEKVKALLPPPSEESKAEEWKRLALGPSAAGPEAALPLIEAPTEEKT